MNLRVMARDTLRRVIEPGVAVLDLLALIFAALENHAAEFLEGGRGIAVNFEPLIRLTRASGASWASARRCLSLPMSNMPLEGSPGTSSAGNMFRSSWKTPPCGDCIT